MMYDFNADDVFEMAQKLEVNGARFYREAGGTLADSDAKALLFRLAEMEDEHAKTFAVMRSRLSAKEKEGTVFDPEGEAGLYLQALADTRVFFEKELDTGSLESILKGAIEAEKDSIVFYLGIKEAVPENLGKDRIEAIIKEEMGHIRLLSRELAALKQ